MSLLSYTESIYNCMISLAASRVKMHWWNEWYNASRARSGPGGGDMCTTLLLMLLCFAYQFQLIIHCSRELNERTDTTIIQHPSSTLHLLLICSGSERSGQLDRINTTAALRESLFNWSDFMGRAFSLKRLKDLQVVVLVFLSALGDNVLKQTLAFALRFKWAHTGEPLGTQARN